MGRTQLCNKGDESNSFCDLSFHRSYLRYHHITSIIHMTLREAKVHGQPKQKTHGFSKERINYGAKESPPRLFNQSSKTDWMKERNCYTTRTNENRLATIDLLISSPRGRANSNTSFIRRCLEQTKVNYLIKLACGLPRNEAYP